MSTSSLRAVAQTAMRALRANASGCQLARQRRASVAAAATAGPSKPIDANAKLDEINEHFAEARLALNDARESLGTVYFEEDFEDAKQAVATCLDAFHGLLEQVDAEKRQSIEESTGMRMRQLREEYDVFREQVAADES